VADLTVRTQVVGADQISRIDLAAVDELVDLVPYSINESRYATIAGASLRFWAFGGGGCVCHMAGFDTLDYSSCEPKGGLSQLSAQIYGRFFWEQALTRA
jgi:hypothetical protein